MSAVTRAARRQAAAVVAALLTAQLVLVTLTRAASARLRNTEADPEAGFTLVEWVIMVVIVAAVATTVTTLIYNWITTKARGVTNDNQQ
jgi:hypothetical protein